MSQAITDDIRSLRGELGNLRDDITKLGATLKDIGRNQAVEAGGRFRASAERGWSGAKHTAETVIGEMEQHPLGTSMTAFIVGVILGCIGACFVCMPLQRK